MMKILNATFRHKVMSVCGDMDGDGDETAFNDAVVKVLDAYSGDCTVDVKIHGFVNVRGVETRIATLIITNKRRVFHSMDRDSKITVSPMNIKGKEKENKITIEQKAVEAVYDAIGLNYGVDSIDVELSEDLLEFMIFNNLVKYDEIVKRQDEIGELWQEYQSK
jgi:hypothetical protein